MNAIQVSVLTPIYNHDLAYVRECLESLHSQTLQEIEFILIDNGADQGAKNIIKEFLDRDKRFICLEMGKNQGYGKAMNAGLKAARGEYIGVVESDDFIDPEMYQKMTLVGFDNDADIVKSLFYFYRKVDQPQVGFRFKPHEYNSIKTNMELPDFCFKYGSYWSAIYKKSMLQNNDIWYDEMPEPSGEDIMFMFKTYFLCKSIYILDKAFYYHRMDNPNSSIHKKFSKINSAMELYRQLTIFMEKNRDKMLPEFWHMKSRREFLNFYWSAISGDIDQQKIKFYKKISRQLAYNLEKGYVSLNPAEARIYNNIVKHPLLTLLKFSAIKHREKDNQKHTYLCGVKVKSETRKGQEHEKNCLYGLYRTIQSPGVEKKKILGFNITHKENGQTKYFGGLIKKTWNGARIGRFPIFPGYTMYKNLMAQLDTIKELHYQTIWLPQKVASLHQQVFPQFKNAHMGEDLVIVGCGPSLNNYNPIKTARHIALNSAIFYKKIKYDYAFIWDLATIYAKGEDQIVDCFLNYDCIKFLGKFLHDGISSYEHLENHNGTLYRCYSGARWNFPGLRSLDFNIHADISMFPLADFKSVAFGALHFAAWTNPKRIFLAGLDTQQTGTFDGRAHPYAINELLNGYKIFKKFMAAHYPDTEIISVNPVGLKGIFTDLYQ